MKRNEHPSYLLFILILSILSLVALAIETLFKLDQSTRTILNYSDNVVCVLFFIDFLIMLVSVENKWKYFITWGWLDLLSSIPMIDIFRWGRVARIMRIFRVLRIVKSAKIITSLILERRAQSVILAVLLVSIVLISVASISILHFEITGDSNIKTPEDAFWWAIVTITTVGYGDKYPVTTEGRIVAAILMAAGIGLFGTFSGFAASWFIGPRETYKEKDIHEIKQEIEEIKDFLKTQKNETKNVLTPK